MSPRQPQDGSKLRRLVLPLTVHAAWKRPAAFSFYSHQYEIFLLQGLRIVLQTLLALQSFFISCHHYFLPGRSPYDWTFRVSLDKSRNAHRAGEKLTCLLTFILSSAVWSQFKKKSKIKDQLEKQCWLERTIFCVTFELTVTMRKNKFLNSKNIETEIFH